LADLIAQGSDSSQRWRRTLPTNEPIVLGRTSLWSVAWDDRISRKHATLDWNGTSLTVRALSNARNPMFFHGQTSSEFQVLPNEHFVIGGTTFTLIDQRAPISIELPQPAHQQSFSTQYLRHTQFRHADERIEILSRLPELISTAASDFDQQARVINLLFAAVLRADVVAIVAAKKAAPVEVLHWDRRLVSSGDFQPSDRLIREALLRKESVLHIWNAPSGPATVEFTAQQGIDWAYCTPVPGATSADWAIYVAGRFNGDRATSFANSIDLHDDLKLSEVVASTLAALRDLQQLERERAGLSQFFSPFVLSALAGENPDVVLRPREADVTVLFCDLRGFSRTSERSASDLLGLLDRVGRALGVATRQICEQGGVLGDFHGDSVMGFWGWPIAESQMALCAARAALAIRAEFLAPNRPVDDPLTDFRVGIGIASGRAVAGKIGTVDQVKVSVFGPVVNLAARLESMTKTLHAPILIDDHTAELLQNQLPIEVGRLRRVARVRPFGLEQSVMVSELLPAESALPILSDQNLADYEQALNALLAGQWSVAFEHLQRIA
jgi:adenylate cyclase